MLRPLIRRALRGVTIKRRLPAEFGRTPIFVAPEAQLKYLKLGRQAFDDGLLQAAYEHIRPGSVVWDVGANCGVFTMAAASLATSGSVLAIEADAWLAGIIAQSLRLHVNSRLKADVLHCAVSDRNGIARFSIANNGRASSYLESLGGRQNARGASEVVTVPTLTLDTILDCSPPPTFVKIDVEGAEVLALRGAGHLLSKHRPTIYVEVVDHAEAAAEVLLAHGYMLFDGARPAAQRRPLRKCARNTLAVPQ